MVIWSGRYGELSWSNCVKRGMFVCGEVVVGVVGVEMGGERGWAAPINRFPRSEKGASWLAFWCASPSLKSIFGDFFPPFWRRCVRAEQMRSVMLSRPNIPDIHRVLSSSFGLAHSSFLLPPSTYAVSASTFYLIASATRRDCLLPNRSVECSYSHTNN